MLSFKDIYLCELVVLSVGTLEANNLQTVILF